MIAARKFPLLDSASYFLLRFLIRSRFHGVYVSGREHFAELDPLKAVIGCANHTNWWDGFIVHLLSKELAGRSSYIAQDEKHLARYRFLSWLGAFGIDLDGSPTAGLRYALRVLASPQSLVWFFPQGHIAHPTKPIIAKVGATFLAKKSAAQLLPVILRYEWMIESRPSILIRIGAPLPDTTKAKELQQCLQTLFDEVVPEPGKFTETFHPLFKPRMSLNKKLDFLIHRLRGERTPFVRENL